MKKLFLILLFAITNPSIADNFDDSERLFNWAETELPQYFSPAGTKTRQIEQYLLRYYPHSDTYIGTDGEDVYIYGDIFGGLLKVGLISDFIETDGPAAELSRGWQWVRNNPMFISGLVTMDAPPADFVDIYFDDFNATAAHLWADGLPWQMDTWAAAENSQFRFVSWLDDDGTSLANGELIGGYLADSSARIGYQVGDEPGFGCPSLQCALDDIKAMQAGIDAVRSADPQALIYLNFEMKDYAEELITYYGQYMDGDIISYDNYSQDAEAYEALETFRAAGLKYNKPYWRYIKSFYFDDGSHSSLSESDLRWDAFSGLVYGYTGHSWFTYNTGEHPVVNPALFIREADFDAGTTELWYVAAQINKEMQNLGRSMTQLTSTDVRYIPKFKLLQPFKTTDWSYGAGGDSYIEDIKPKNNYALLDISVGFFADDSGEIYFMLQNVSHEHGYYEDIPLNKTGKEKIRVSFDFSTAPENISRSSLLSLNKLTGEVETLPMSSVDGNESYIDIKLEAGDPILLKYDTGAPFAMQ